MQRCFMKLGLTMPLWTGWVESTQMELHRTEAMDGGVPDLPGRGTAVDEGRCWSSAGGGRGGARRESGLDRR